MCVHMSKQFNVGSSWFWAQTKLPFESKVKGEGFSFILRKSVTLKVFLRITKDWGHILFIKTFATFRTTLHRYIVLISMKGRIELSMSTQCAFRVFLSPLVPPSVNPSPRLSLPLSVSLSMSGPCALIHASVCHFPPLYSVDSSIMTDIYMSTCHPANLLSVMLYCRKSTGILWLKLRKSWTSNKWKVHITQNISHP